MEKNTGTITIVILLTLIFCTLIGAFVFGWFGFKDLKSTETPPTDATKKDPLKPDAIKPDITLRKDEVKCGSASILANRYVIDPDDLVTLLETGRAWTSSAKEASLQYFKKTVDDDAKRYRESIRWEVVTADELRFVVRLGSGLGIAIERMMQQNDISYKKTCLEKFRVFI